MSSESSRTETYLDDDDYTTYENYGGSNTSIDKQRKNPKNIEINEDEEETKEYRRKLLISLGMLLPAIAAIIGVMAWAISAEVVLGAKREASRRIGESGGGGNYLKLPNRYDYSRFTSAPLLPPKEMLVDHRNYNNQSRQHKSSKTSKNLNKKDDESNNIAVASVPNLNILQKHLEELSKEYLNRRSDLDENSVNKNLNELKNRLAQENLSQLFAKLFNNNYNNKKPSVDNNNNNNNDDNDADKPRIVVVAPLAASQSKTLFSETRVTTSKPKALELKIGSSKDNNSNHHNNHQNDKNSLKNDQMIKSSTTNNKNSIKRKVNQNVVVNNNNNNGKKVTSKQSQGKISIDSNKRKQSNQVLINEKKSTSSSSRNLMTNNGKNFSQKQNAQQQNFKNSKNQSINNKQQQPMVVTGKVKGAKYEKEIDMLLQKIEKLEKQKLHSSSTIKLKSPKITVKDYDKKPSGIISEKIKKFMETAPKEERNEPSDGSGQDHHHQWDAMTGSMMPPPPPVMPPPPMPIMPFMPYIPAMPSMPTMPMSPEHTEIPQVSEQQQQQQHQQMPSEMNQMMPGEYPDYQQQQQQYYQQAQPQSTAYMQTDGSYMTQQQQPLQPVPVPMPSQQQTMVPTIANSYPQTLTTYPQQQQQLQPTTDNIQMYQQNPQVSQPMSNIVQQPSSSNQVNTYSYPTQSNHIYNSMSNDQMNQIQSNQQQQQQSTQSTSKSKKPNKSVSLFGRRFQIGKIFHSVLPKGKKTKKEQDQKAMLQQQQHQPDSFDQLLTNPPTLPPPIEDNNAPFDPLMTQESQYHSAVDRGYHRPSKGYPMETAGMSVRFGGGPLGGGSQVKVNPMAILKTLAFPMMRKPALNLNGKVVFGVVLENGGGYGKKPKTVIQHYSTGRIKRR